MSPRRAVVALLLASVFVIGAATPAVAAAPRHFAIMNGANEFPGPGDPDGSGVVITKMRTQAGRICVELAFNGVGPTLTGFHIHIGAAGTSGGIEVDMTSLIPTRGGCISADPADLAAIAANPAGYYCNLHSSEFPAGAIRGQLQASS